VVGDDAGEEEWEVEEICDRELDDGGLKFLVKWKDGEKTWGSYENVSDTKARGKMWEGATVVGGRLRLADAITVVAQNLPTMERAAMHINPEKEHIL
jgi:hypothetical protein